MRRPFLPSLIVMRGAVVSRIDGAAFGLGELPQQIGFAARPKTGYAGLYLGQALRKERQAG